MKNPKKITAQSVTPFLWFDGQVEEAVSFYTAIFANSKVLSVSPMSATFELAGQRLMALNGGPRFKFNEAVSLFVSCKTQDEVDYFWEQLSDGGEESRCGWLKDKFGLSWQIIPEALGELLGDEDEGRSQRALQAMLKMGKLDIEKLEAAAAGE
jgi:predicted 3-demethylubiquinone-9 3-methyltransferase (glyoxalase superfamily)